MCEDLQTIGLPDGRIVTKSDQEPSMVDVVNEAAKLRSKQTGGGVGMDTSRVGDSSSNGKIERAIRKLKGLIRTMRSDLEKAVGEKINIDSPIVPWLVRHAAYVLTRCYIEPDGGRTP